MESKRMSFDLRPMPGQSGRARASGMRAQQECGRVIARASLCPSVASLIVVGQRLDHAKTGEEQAKEQAKGTGEKVLFCGVKRLNRMEIFPAKNFAKT